MPFSGTQVKSSQLLKGKYQDILDDFKYDGFLGPDPNIQKVRNCVDVFLKSQELCNTISKGSFLLGVGLKAISIDADTVQRMADAESLKESDDMYVKMLDILVKNLLQRTRSLRSSNRWWKCSLR